MGGGVRGGASGDDRIERRLEIEEGERGRCVCWCRGSMSCPRVQLTPVLSLLGGLVSLSTLLASTLSPSWRSQRLASGGRTQANLTVTDGLWERCVRVESGSDRCIYRDVQWYRTVDQLDIRLLQLGLPLSLGVGTIALFLTALGVCQTACTSSTPGSGITHCSVNSAGCFLISGVLYLLSCALCLSPTLYLLFHTRRLNQRFGPDWTSGIGVLLALGSAAGLLGCAGLQTLWYCLCRGSRGDGQLWQPLLGPQGTPIYLGPPLSCSNTSRRSRLSTLEIDIPIIRHQAC